MKELITTIERTIKLLETSEDSPWATDEVAEIKPLLQKFSLELKEKGKLGIAAKNKLKYLFLPTGSLQEISITNGWGNEYLEISEVVDKYLS